MLTCAAFTHWVVRYHLLPLLLFVQVYRCCRKCGSSCRSRSYCENEASVKRQWEFVEMLRAMVQNIWSEECLISWLNELAKDKVIPDYPAMRKGHS